VTELLSYTIGIGEITHIKDITMAEILILHCTLKASNLRVESSVFRRILNAFQDKLAKINDYKNECWILEVLLGNLLPADISHRTESISIGDITDVRDITTAEILILQSTLIPC